MDEIEKALAHGWTWQGADAEGITRDPACHTTALGAGDGQLYQKVQCGGVPVAYIRTDDGGTQDFLLPPAANLPDFSDDREG